MERLNNILLRHIRDSRYRHLTGMNHDVTNHVQNPSQQGIVCDVTLS
jgi:hypothetical protein